MSKLHIKNQKGFTAVEGLVVIIVVVVIASAGLYVRSKVDIKDSTMATTSSNSSASTKLAATKSGDSERALSLAQVGMSAQYPSDWSFETNAKNSATNITFYLTAPNTTFDSAPDLGDAAVTTGAQIRIYKSIATKPYTVDDFKTQQAAASNPRKNIKYFKVDTKDAVAYDLGYENPDTHYVDVFDGVTSFSVTIQNAAYMQANYAKVFDNLIRTIKFE